MKEKFKNFSEDEEEEKKQFSETELKQGGYLKDSSAAEDTYAIKEIIEKGLSLVTPREREVLTKHYLEDKTFATIANELSISRGTVSEIEARALSKIRFQLESRADLHPGDIVIFTYGSRSKQYYGKVLEVNSEHGRVKVFAGHLSPNKVLELDLLQIRKKA